MPFYYPSKGSITNKIEDLKTYFQVSFSEAILQEVSVKISFLKGTK